MRGGVRGGTRAPTGPPRRRAPEAWETALGQTQQSRAHREGPPGEAHHTRLPGGPHAAGSPAALSPPPRTPETTIQPPLRGPEAGAALGPGLGEQHSTLASGTPTSTQGAPALQTPRLHLQALIPEQEDQPCPAHLRWRPDGPPQWALPCWPQAGPRPRAARGGSGWRRVRIPVPGACCRGCSAADTRGNEFQMGRGGGSLLRKPEITRISAPQPSPCTRGAASRAEESSTRPVHAGVRRGPPRRTTQSPPQDHGPSLATSPWGLAPHSLSLPVRPGTTRSPRPGPRDADPVPARCPRQRGRGAGSRHQTDRTKPQTLRLRPRRNHAPRGRSPDL